MYTTIRFVLQGSGDFTWWVSDCEELVGLLTGDDGVGFRQCLSIPLTLYLKLNLYQPTNDIYRKYIISQIFYKFLRMIKLDHILELHQLHR